MREISKNETTFKIFKWSCSSELSESSDQKLNSELHKNNQFQKQKLKASEIIENLIKKLET